MLLSACSSPRSLTNDRASCRARREASPISGAAYPRVARSAPVSRMRASSSVLLVAHGGRNALEASRARIQNGAPLPICRPLGGEDPSALPLASRVDKILGAGEMKRQLFRMRLDGFPRMGCENLSHPSMQRAAMAQQQAFVRGVLNQRVLERIPRVGDLAPGDQQVRAHEPP